MTMYGHSERKSCIIKRIPKIALLKSLGIREGMSVSIVSKQPMGGPVVVKLGKRNIAIARNIAEQIQVEGA
ncbi:MAG: ferrous iron transport protein A [Clostridiales bacterium]|nr:ferrous iron transport protein A [Clostridiales bacterium]